MSKNTKSIQTNLTGKLIIPLVDRSDLWPVGIIKRVEENPQYTGEIVNVYLDKDNMPKYTVSFEKRLFEVYSCAFKLYYS